MIVGMVIGISIFISIIIVIWCCRYRMFRKNQYNQVEIGILPTNSVPSEFNDQTSEIYKHQESGLKVNDMPP